MGWNDRPHAGEKWRRRRPQKTRTVVDRTLGGDVVFVNGRRTRFARQEQCTETEWAMWQSEAKQVLE